MMALIGSDLDRDYYTARRRWFYAPKGMKRAWERRVKALNTKRLKVEA